MPRARSSLHTAYLAGDLAVLDIVVAVLHVVAAQHLDLAHILVALPLQEVDLLEKLLLVKLELAHQEAGSGERTESLNTCEKVSKGFVAKVIVASCLCQDTR